MYDVIIAIDVEATGPEPSQAEIIELAAAVWENSAITRRFQTLVKPARALPRAVSKLTGITPEMLATAPPREAAIADFLAFLPPDAVCIAHRAAYD
ncbi:MAG: 3'-5' exonuclease, partial [Planctomycetota bacterium]|nr:3'-5' exonuclease [Planctomycetota bacterium]